MPDVDRKGRARRPSGTRIAARVAAAACLLGIASPAVAADVTKCVEGNARAQDLRRDGKLAAARAELMKCGDPACPQMVRDDCAARLDEVEKAQPTVVFEARDGDGHDLAAVTVTVDGQPLADRLAGRALRVDPGEHTFVFTAGDRPPVTRQLILREGEKERHEGIVIGTPSAPAPTPGSPALPSATPGTEATPSSGLGTRRIAGLVMGGVGVVGLGLGAAFGLMASSAWSNAKSACGGDVTRCTDPATANSDRNTTTSDGTLSTIGFVAGGALLAGGAVLFLLPTASQGTSSARVTVVPAVGVGHGGLLVSGSF
ncbi:MAG: hypothetical protein ACRENE_12795 [Polyangiaceae bacterium]